MLHGERLKALRESKRYTHQHLANMLGLAMVQVWRYEAGKTDPSGDVLARMAKVFNVSVDYLLGLTDTPLPPGVSASDLSEKERNVIAALREGEPYEAIKLIVADT
jgi:transcriptional regulator with XRE-family HTH domain